MRHGRIILILLLSCVLLLACFSGCGSDADTDTTDLKTDVPRGTETTQDPELADPKRDWEPIETKYGRLRFPDDLFDYLETVQTENGDALSILFRAVIRDERIDLFELSIGGEGDPVGRITGPDGVVRNISLRFLELEDLPELSEGETNRVYAMQEALNFILDHSK